MAERKYRRKTKSKRTTKKKRRILTFIVIVVLIFLAISGYFAKEKGLLSGVGELEIYFVDVGQGDCIIVKLPDGKNMIIDGGENTKTVSNKLKTTIDGLGIKKFDYLIATHQDSDHIGSLDYVLENYEVITAYRPNVHSDHESVKELSDIYNSADNGGKVSTSQAYADFLTRLYEEKCEVIITDRLSDISVDFSSNGSNCNYKLDFLTPTALDEDVKYNKNNDYSPIMVLSYNGFEILFAGDAEFLVENEYLEYYTEYVDCDVLKVGHHGSESSSSEKFIEAIKPEYAVILCGEDKIYKHPRQITLDTLKKSECTVYRSDLNGDIKLSVKSGLDFDFTTEKNSADVFVGADTKID